MHSCTNDLIFALKSLVHENLCMYKDRVGGATCFKFLNYMALFITGNVVACRNEIKSLVHI